MARAQRAPVFGKEGHRSPIYSIEVNHVDPSSNVFATAGSTGVCVYAMLEGGAFELLQSYQEPQMITSVRADEETVTVYCCCWAEVAGSRAPLLCFCGSSGVIRVADTSQRRVVKSLLGHGSDVNDLKIHPVDRNLLLSCGKDESVRLWNLTTDAPVAIFAGTGGHCGDVLQCDFHLSGDRFVSCGMDSCTKVWALTGDVAEAIKQSYVHNELTAKRAFPTRFVQYPVFSNNRHHFNYVDCVRFVGGLILSKSVHSTILLWQPLKFDKKQSRCEEITIAEFPFKGGNLWFVKFAVHLPTLRLATGTADGKIYVWSMKEIAPKLLIILHERRCTTCVRQVAFTHSGSTVLGCCDDGTLWSWDLGKVAST